MTPRLARWFLPPLVLVAALGLYRLVVGAAARPSDTLAALTARTPRVFRPLRNDPRVVSDAQLAEILARVLPPAGPVNTNHWLHALRLWGPQAHFERPGIPSGAEMRDFLLDDRVYQQLTGPATPPLWKRDATGVCPRSFDEVFEYRTTSSYHTDDLLATLGESGLSLDTRLELRDGQATVEDVLRTALESFHRSRLEYEWTAISYARYCQPLVGWRNRFGERLDADALADQLMQRPPQFGPCHGIHRLEATVLLLRADASSPALRRSTRRRLEQYLTQMVVRLAQTQAIEGYWTADWWRGATAEQMDRSSIYERILVTGHHLEWLALAPDGFELPQEQTARAGQWLAHALMDFDERNLQEHYGPLSHAARALCLWRGQEAWEVWQHFSGSSSLSIDSR